MKRCLAFLRQLLLGLLTVAVLATLVAADYHVRVDPARKAARLLQAMGVPLSEAGAARQAALGNLFALEQFAAAGWSLGLPDPGSGETPLLAAIRAGERQAVAYLLGAESSREHLDAAARADGRTALSLSLERGDLELAGQLVEMGAGVDVCLDPELPLVAQAFLENNWEVFDFLIGRGADPDAAGPDGLPLLALAVGNRDQARVEQLLAARAHPDAAGVTGDPLVLEAVGRSDLPLAAALLGAGADPDSAGASGQTALMAAVKGGKHALAALLLERGADPDKPGPDKRTPLAAALEARDVAMMQVLLDGGADAAPVALARQAFRNRDVAALRLLLRSGADPGATLDQGRTLLDEAFAWESEHLIRVLLEAGASARGTLWSALSTGKAAILELALGHGASPGEREPGSGRHPLEDALDEGRDDLAAVLLGAGADPNVKRQDGESILAFAIRQGSQDAAEALLAHGACTEGLAAADGHTLLGWAIARKMSGVAGRLIAEGADPRAREPAPATEAFTEAFARSRTFRWHLKTDSQINPLLLAAAQGEMELARLLLEAGARRGDHSRRYLWPVNVAAWHGDVPMMQTILGRDPDPDKQPRKVVVEISTQKATFYENGKVAHTSRVSTGRRGKPTPTGTFVITDKHRHHTSSIYGSSMPYFMRLSCAAFGLHQGALPGYPASAGCIRLPGDSARLLFAKCEIGDVVEIRR